MQTYNNIRNQYMSLLRAGESASFPVPVVVEGKLLDIVFIHTVAKDDKTANAPTRCIVVDTTAGTAEEMSLPISLAELQFERSPFKMPSNLRVKVKQLESLYGDVREEVSTGSLGSASMSYGSLVWDIAQESLRDYYSALNPQLFERATLA